MCLCASEEKMPVVTSKYLLGLFGEKAQLLILLTFLNDY